MLSIRAGCSCHTHNPTHIQLNEMLAIQSLTSPQVVALAFGTVSCGYGVRAILSPFNFARDFGLPQVSTNAKPDFIRATGGRTAALGLAIVSLSLQGQHQASGTILMSCVVSGLIDTFITYHSGSATGFIQHAIGSAVLGGLGWYLMASTR